MKNIPQDEKEKLTRNIKAMRVIRFALQSDKFRLVSTCTTVKVIWERLKELYYTDVDLKHDTQTLLLSEVPLLRSQKKVWAKHSIATTIFSAGW